MKEIKMNNEELKELQKYGLDILKEVDKFCRENNIKYFLGEGTLLGAIRHKGYIPWDDDIDILMLREDFEKFVNNFKSEDYGIEYFNTMKYWNVFAKVRLLKETKFYSPRLEKLQKYTGPRIDIMPLDYFPNKIKFQERVIIKIVSLLKILLRNKVIPSKKKKNVFGYMVWILAKIIPYKLWVKLINHFTQKFNKNKCEYVINYGSEYKKTKEIFPIKYFEKSKEVPFENCKFYISPNYDEMLTQIYGDYMTLPPKEKRVIKHDIKVRKSERDD